MADWGSSRWPKSDNVMRLLLLGYTVELFVTALLGVQPLPLFFKLADRRRNPLGAAAGGFTAGVATRSRTREGRCSHVAPLLK